MIASLRCDRHGCVGALVEVDGSLLAVARRRHPAAHVFAGFHAVAADAVLGALHAVLGELATAAQGRTLAAIGLTATRPSALLIGPENRFCSPVLFGDGAPLPSRDVPSDFAEPRLARLWRQSVVRQVAERVPEAALGLQRVVSLGALLHRELSGHWVDAVAGRPTSAPAGDARSGYYASDEATWRVCGMERRTMPLLVPPGGIAAQLTARVARRYGWPGGTPLVATSDALGCLAYGLKSDAAAWVVELGDGLRAGWCAQPLPPERVSMQIIEPGTAPDEPQALTPQQASQAVVARLGALVEAAPGPRAELVRYELRTVEGLFEAGGGALYRDSALRIETPHQPLAGPQLLQAAPLGCDGLRLLPGRTTAALVGLRPGHGQAHLVRAALEGLSLELGRWRLLAGVLGADVPRVVVTRPWASEVVQWVADAIGETVLFWAGEPELPTLLGQALAIIRDLELAPQASPTLSLHAIEPGARADAYRAQRGVHLAVMEAMTGVIS